MICVLLVDGVFLLLRRMMAQEVADCGAIIRVETTIVVGPVASRTNSIGMTMSDASFVHEDFLPGRLSTSQSASPERSDHTSCPLHPRAGERPLRPCGATLDWSSSVNPSGSTIVRVVETEASVLGRIVRILHADNLEVVECRGVTSGLCADLNAQHIVFCDFNVSVLLENRVRS